VATRSSTTVAWTERGRAALAEERSGFVPLWTERSDRELDDAIGKTIARDRAAWRRGLAKGDALGKAAVGYALGARAEPSIDDAAGLASLLGAIVPADVAPYVERSIRSAGVEFTVGVLVAMWARATEIGTTSNGHVVHLRAIAADDPNPFDGSASRAKGRFAEYLGKRAPDGIAAAVRAAWPSASLVARVALAVAARDPALAAGAGRAMLARRGGASLYARGELAYLVTDAELADRLDAQPCCRLIDSLGAKALPIFERAIAGRVDKRTRGRYLEQLANLRGARVARLIAEYEDSYPELARAYFTAHRDLLARALRDPELRYHRDALEKLRD
jgi:hypothetical protein